MSNLPYDQGDTSDDEEDLVQDAPVLEDGVQAGQRIRQTHARTSRFDRARFSGASDKFKSAVSGVEANQWDVEAWEVLVNEAQERHSGRINLREVLRLLLEQFPLAARYWRLLVQLELDAGNMAAVEEALEHSLMDCASIDLWLLYVAKVKRTDFMGENPVGEAREHIAAAFELAVQNVGLSPQSAPLWSEYAAYVKTWPKETQAEAGVRMERLRGIYQRAVTVPSDSVERLWNEYQQFEMSMSEHLAKVKFIPETLPRVQAAKAVYKERKQAWEGIEQHNMAVPPTNSEEEAQQLELWRRRLQYERENPERVDPASLRARLHLSYKQCICCLRFFPEMWYEWAECERGLGFEDEAAKIYQRAAGALPTSSLLCMAHADLEERRGRGARAKELWITHLAASPSTAGYVMFQRFIRRTEGKAAARKVFAAARPLRMAGQLGHQFYLAHARMELHSNGEPEIATRVMEYGLSQHKEFIQEPAYVLAYVDMLAQRNDEENLRTLFDRVLDVSAMPADKADPVWDRFVELEYCLARSGGSLAKAEAVEHRRAERYPLEAHQRGLLKLWRRCMSAGTGPLPDARDDQSFVQRCLETEEGLDHISSPYPRGGKGAASRRNKASEGTKPAKRDSAEYASAHSSLPPFLFKLLQVLPRHVGPHLYQVERVLQSIQERPLPDQPAPPSGPPSSASVGGKSQLGKRSREDSDDEGANLDDGESAWHKRPAIDLFRQRQQAKLTPFGQ